MTDERIDLRGRKPIGSPPGRCIYCNVPAADSPLSDEHVIPHSLGMDAYLPKASCAKCAKITSYLEGFVGREIFGHLRAFYKVQSRKNRLHSIQVPLIFSTEAGEETRYLRITEGPPALLLLMFGMPGILMDAQPSPDLKETQGWAWYSSEMQTRIDALRRPGDTGWKLPVRFKSDVFARFLAKVAHVLAVAHYGIDSFRPFLPNLILGNDDKLGYLIGGVAPPTDADPPLPPGTHAVHAHEIGLQILVRGDSRLIACYIRLFAFTGSPTYGAVVGEAGPKVLESHGIQVG